MSGPIVDPDVYRAIVETAPDATVMIDSEGVITLVNRQTEVLFGYDRAELVGKRVEVLVPERFRSRHLVHRDGYFGEPKTREMGAGIELYGLRRDGREFPVEISLAPLRAAGEVYAIASVRDGTARKKSRDQLNNLLETAPDAMVIIDGDGLINRVNAQTERLFGYARAALVGKPVEVLVPEHLRDKHRSHRKGYFTDPKVRGMGAGLRLSGRRKNGTEFPIEISLSPLTTDEGVFATAAVRDISDRLSAERRFRDLLDSAPDAMVIINETGTIELVNRQAETLFGYTREELVGQPVSVLTPPELREAHNGHLRRYYREPRVREMGAGLELAGYRKDGTTFPVEISLAPLHTGKDRWVTAAIRDVTDRKESQQILREYTARLEASNEELEQFAYIASHDLQTPLRSVVSFAQILRRSLPEEVDPKVLQCLHFIEDGSQRMHTLVKDILALSRVGRSGAAFRPVNLQQLAEKVIAEVAPNGAGEQVHLEPLPTVDGDEAQLGQVLQNLIGNALKFHAPDVAPEAWVTCESTAAGWTISVGDNGIGIAAEQRQKVFEIFARLHTREQYAGTGIGLAICKRIVERHGGVIGIADSPHGGCTFWFTLPRELEAQP